MFYRFNAHKAKRPVDPDSSKDVLAERIADKLILIQKRWSGFMSAKASRLPVRTLKVSLLVSGLITTGFCLYLVADGFINIPPTLFKVSRIKALWPFEKGPYTEDAHRKREIEIYLDSLEKELIYDSIQNSNIKNNK